MKQIWLLAYVILTPMCFSQNFKVASDELGTLYDEHTNLIGSAFVVAPQKHIVTCAHVAADNPVFYHWVNTNIFVRIRSLYVLPRYDLAVFECETNLPSKGFSFGDIHRIRPGDIIAYAGIEVQGGTMVVSAASVLGVGTAANDGVNIDFLEFVGIGKPGFSGGPVFNLNGEIVAVMREAWTKRGVKGGDSVLINRAFSTDILKILHEQVYSSGPIPRSGTSGGNMDLLDLIEESGQTHRTEPKP